MLAELATGAVELLAGVDLLLLEEEERSLAFILSADCFELGLSLLDDTVLGLFSCLLSVL